MAGKKSVSAVSIVFFAAVGAPAVGQQATATNSPTASSAGQQSAAPAAGGLEEVVVTAEKRAEDIEKTPIAVTAVGGDSLKDQSITRTTDINGLIPAVELGSGFTGAGA